MISEISKKWIEAGRILAENPEEKVKCPECGQNDLIVNELISKLEPGKKERMVYCPTCGAKNYIRL